jgi:TonB family protein
MKHKTDPGKQQNSSLDKFQKFILFSVFFHIILSFTVIIVPQLQKTKTTPVEIVLIDTPKSEEEITTQKTPKTKQKLRVQQIVETNEKQANNEIDKNAAYLSAKNNTVQKETVAKNIGKFQNTNSKTSAAEQLAQAAIEKEIAKNNNEKKSASKLFNTGFDVYSALNKNKDVQKKSRKEQSFQNGSSPQQASATQDHIDATEPSLMTQLNTREYKYYGYNMRIRSQLDQWYQTQLRDQLKKLLSRGRNIASENNKRTQLLIILNDKGNLVGVQVVGASGVRELDDAAVETFRKAAPFPNPPKGMVENDGTIRVRWDFVLS